MVSPEGFSVFLVRKEDESWKGPKGKENPISRLTCGTRSGTTEWTTLRGVRSCEPNQEIPTVRCPAKYEEWYIIGKRGCGKTEN